MSLEDYWKMRALFAEEALEKRIGMPPQEHQKNQEEQGNKEETRKPRWIGVSRLPHVYKP